MPKLWTETIDAHRREVRDAILDTTATLVAEQGLLSVTMSQIAETTGIGRATLYKYFPDTEAILLAWHERQVTGYLDRLTQAAARAAEPIERLVTVLTTYAHLLHKAYPHHDADFAAVLHRTLQAHQAQHSGPHGAPPAEPLAEPHRRLHQMIQDLIADAVAAGAVRADVPPEELSTYCIHALTGAKASLSDTAVDHLVEVTLDGLHCHHPDRSSTSGSRGAVST